LETAEISSGCDWQVDVSAACNIRRLIGLKLQLELIALQYISRCSRVVIDYFHDVGCAVLSLTEIGSTFSPPLAATERVSPRPIAASRGRTIHGRQDQFHQG
jgi:hypothetical protein